MACQQQNNHSGHTSKRRETTNLECHTSTAFVYCTYNCIGQIKTIYFSINKLFSVVILDLSVELKSVTFSL